MVANHVIWVDYHSQTPAWRTCYTDEKASQLGRARKVAIFLVRSNLLFQQNPPVMLEVYGKPDFPSLLSPKPPGEVSMTYRPVFPPYCRAIAVVFFLSLALALACIHTPRLAAQDGSTKTAAEPLAFDIQLDTVHKEFDGTFCWFHPRVGAIPKGGRDGKPAVVMTLQKWLLSASDFFSALSDLRTDDLGASWTGPREHQELGWRNIGENSVEGVCDFTPGWHAPSGKLLAVGHTVRYKNDKSHGRAPPPLHRLFRLRRKDPHLVPLGRHQDAWNR